MSTPLISAKLNNAIEIYLINLSIKCILYKIKLIIICETTAEVVSLPIINWGVARQQLFCVLY